MQDLSGLPLRDIHPPPPVDWWPPAPGWWLVAAIVLAGLVTAILATWRDRRRRRRPLRRALAELARIERRYGRDGDAGALVSSLSALLRRAAITARPREEVAALTGRDWLRFLDRGMPGRPFSEGPGACLADGPYRPGGAALDGPTARALLPLARERLSRLLGGGSDETPAPVRIEATAAEARR